MGYLVLSEADQARLGCPSKLPFDHTTVTNREAVVLARFGGWHTPRLWYRALTTTPVYLNDDGTSRILGRDEERPDEEPYDAAVDPVAWTAAVWIALRRAGIPTDLDTLEFDLQNLRLVEDEDDEPAPKDADVEESTSTVISTTSTGT